MDMELTTFEDMISGMRGRLAGPGHLVIVDGVAGAGQKSVAAQIASQFGCEVIETDEAADAKKIKKDIEEKRAKANVVVSGILIRKTMADAALQPDIAVYAVPSRKNNRRKFWEGILSKSLPEFLAELKDDLDKKTVEYHWKYHPIIHANYLVEGD